MQAIELARSFSLHTHTAQWVLAELVVHLPVATATMTTTT